MPDVTFDPKKPMDWIQGLLGLFLIGLAVTFAAGLLAPEKKVEAQAAPPSSPPAMAQKSQSEPKPQPVPELPIGEQVEVQLMYASAHFKVDNQTGHELMNVNMKAFPGPGGPYDNDHDDIYFASDLGSFPRGVTMVRCEEFVQYSGEALDRWSDPISSVSLTCDQGYSRWGFQD